MSTYIKFLELLVQSTDMHDAFKKMLKGKDFKKSGEQVKKYIEKYGRLCSNPIYERDFYYDKTGPKVQFITYYVFPFVTSGPLRHVPNLVKLYKFFFLPETVVLNVKFAYE